MSTPPPTQHIPVPPIPPRDASPDEIADSLVRIDFWLVQTFAPVEVDQQHDSPGNSGAAQDPARPKLTPWQLGSRA